MAEDVLAHEDANIDPPPLHTVDTVKVAEYITEHFSNPILAKFIADMHVSNNSTRMQVEGENTYLELVSRVMEKMKRYFRHAAGELKEGMSWALPDWIDLQVNEQIIASDLRISNEVRHGSMKSNLRVKKR